MKKQISNRVIILSYFKYFFSCLLPHLTRTKDIKAAFSGSFSIKSAKDVFCISAFAKNNFLLSDYINKK